jgi:polysaccharide biosynthesis transport protein
MESPVTDNRLPLSLRIAEWSNVLRRHLRTEAAVALLAFTAAFVYVRSVPDVYRAETRILVNPQLVSDKYVSSTAAIGTNERLNTLSQQVMSSTRLQAIVEEFHLYPKLRRTMGQEQVLDLMRSHISIEMKQSSTGPSSFTIAYTGDSAKDVAGVANRLAESFIAWNLHDREQEAQGTTEFLSKQLAGTKSQLDQLEEQIRTYKLQHVGSLPDQTPANLQTLSRLQVQLQANIDAQSRLDHEAFLAQFDSLPGSEGTPTTTPTPSSRQQLLARDTQAHRELAELRQRYTPEFPDVLSKQQEVNALDAQVAKLPTAQPVAATQTDSIANSNPRLQLIDRDRERLSKAQREIEDQINSYQARVDAEPIREQEIAQLVRGYDTAKEHYRSLLEKTYSAQMATELEHRQEGGNFTMLDPARVPDAPIGPNRVALLIGSFLASLAAGIGAGLLLERMDNTVKSEAQLRDLLPDLPLLGLTPRLPAVSGAKPNLLSLLGNPWSKP